MNKFYAHHLTEEQVGQVEAFIKKLEAENNVREITIDGEVLEISPETDIIFPKIKTIEGLRDLINFAPISPRKEVRKGSYDYKNDFHFALDNGLKERHVKLSYDTGKTSVYATLPEEMFKEFLTNGFRRVSDTEHHYFGGVSMGEINGMRIRTNKWKSGLSVKYFHKDSDALIGESNNEVLNKLLTL